MVQEEPVARKINIRLQFRSKIPLSDQVRHGIFDLIQRRVLEEGDLLPTVRELAAQLGVNFNTIARAYRVLDREGWLMTRQGRGTVVTRPQTANEEDPYLVGVRHLAIQIMQLAEQFQHEPRQVLKELERQLTPPSEPANQPGRPKRKRAGKFRAYQAAFPRSRKTRRETLDFRLRKPIQ